MTADVVQGTDMRMVQTGDGSCFPFESLSPFRLLSWLLRKNLDSNDSVEAGIERSIDLAHAAASGQAEYRIRTKPTAEQ
jgi:hypothetical protein